MISPAATERARQLAADGVAFVTATVVRAQHPTSVQAGNVALVRSDGSIEGFVGGVCAEHSVRLYSMKVLEAGEPLLLRILPDAEHPAEEDDVTAGHELPDVEGAVTVQNPCLSGGAIEIFLEPVLPAPRVHVVGETPIAGAIHRIGGELGLELVMAGRGTPRPLPGDLALIVAAHGRDELAALRAGLEAGLPYIGLVASPKRGAALIDELREAGVADELVESIDVPAGLAIGAHTPGEIALSILASVVAVRRETGFVPASAPGPAPGPAPSLVVTTSPPADAPRFVVDPICGMTVAALPTTPSIEHDGETVYFCCERCRDSFAAQHGHAVASG